MAITAAKPPGGDSNPQPASLPLVFTLAETLEHSEPGLLGVRNGQRLELVRRIEGGNDFAHRLFARRTMRQRFGRKWPAQREFPAADLAAALAQFVFVKGHNEISNLIVKADYLSN